MHDGFEHQAQRVHQDVPLAPVDLLAAVEAAQSPHGRGLDALAVDDARARLRIAPRHDAHVLAQGCVEMVPGAVQTEPSEPPVDGLPGRVLVGHSAPLTAGADHVEDAVENLAQGMLPGAAPEGRDGQVFDKKAILIVRQVARIRLAHAKAAPQSPFPAFSNSLQVRMVTAHVGRMAPRPSRPGLACRRSGHRRRSAAVRRCVYAERGRRPRRERGGAVSVGAAGSDARGRRRRPSTGGAGGISTSWKHNISAVASRLHLSR